MDRWPPFEFDRNRSDSHGGEAEKPEVGAAEVRLRDARMAELADGVGAAREEEVDGVCGHPEGPVEEAVSEGLPAAAPGAGEHGGAGGVADGEAGEDLVLHRRRKRLQDVRRGRGHFSDD